jgi:predicted RNase H-like HicB family nuclease
MTGSVFTAIIEREGNLYVALCPELDVASQGTSIENALENLKEAVALFIETAADPGEMKERPREHVFVTQFQAADGDSSRRNR